MIFKCKNKFKSAAVFLSLTILSALVFCGCPHIGECLGSPENLTVTDLTDESAVVSWTAVRGAAVYEIMWSLKDNDWWRFERITGTTFKLTELLAEETYTVKVCAFPEDTESHICSNQTIKEFTTLEKKYPVGEFAPPKNVKLTPNEEKTNVTITWDAVEGSAYYEIKCCYEFYSSEEEKYVTQERIVTVSANKTSYTDTERNGYNVIQYSVAARDADFSNIGEKLHWSETVNLKK